MRAGERLPEHHADCPDVAGGRALLAREPLGRDVRERARHVADRRQGLGLREGREAEVEQPHRDAVLGHEHVRRLHVAVDDAALVRVREPLEQLRAGLDGSASPSSFERCTSRNVRPGAYS